MKYFLYFFIYKNKEFLMHTKKDTRGRPLKADDTFIEEFIDKYASVEPFWKPETVPASVMINRVLEQKEQDDTPENRKAVTALTRQFMPGTDRYNSKKYNPILEQYRQKYKHIVTFQTHENLSVVASMIPEVARKLVADGEFSIADLVALIRVNNETAKHIQGEQREDRQEIKDTAKDSSVTEGNVEKATKVLELMQK
ncbi:MAG: hypothetical protein OXG15_10925 [Gammaproteobacteria bacterium]|nr:hypothetical protein [Gammaproteobacteria bacterium]